MHYTLHGSNESDDDLGVRSTSSHDPTTSLVLYLYNGHPWVHDCKLVIVTTVAFLVIPAGAVAEFAYLACAYDPLAIAAAVRINLQRCLSHADGGGSGDGTCPGEVIATTDDDARRPWNLLQTGGPCGLAANSQQSCWMSVSEALLNNRDRGSNFAIGITRNRDQIAIKSCSQKAISSTGCHIHRSSRATLNPR